MTREKVHWRQHVADLGNTLKAFIGTNYLSLAYGFKLAGLGFGLFGLVVVAFLTNHCCKLIVVCKQRAIAQLLAQYTAEVGNDEEDEVEMSLLKTRLISNLSYTDLGRLTLGRWGVVIVNTCVLVTQFGFCIGYCIFVGNMTHQLIVGDPSELPTPHIAENLQHPFISNAIKREVPETDFNFTGEFLGSMTKNGSDFILDILKQADLLNVSVPDVDAHHEINAHGSKVEHSKLVDGSNNVVDPTANTPSNHKSDSELTITSGSENDTPKVSSSSPPSNIRVSTLPPSSESTILQHEDSSTHSPTKNLNHALQDDTSATRTDSHSTAFPSVGDCTDQGLTTKASSRLLTWAVLATLPIFVVLTLFRNVRQLAMISLVANVSIFSGFFCVLGYIVFNFKFSDDIDWFNFATVPVYFVQIFAAFEAIGCILPIESSMEGNQHNFPFYMNVVVISYTFLMGLLAMFGYLNYGNNVQQIIAQNLPVEESLVVVINITLIIGVVLTYPLQIFPVVEIIENNIFAEGRCCGPTKRVLSIDEDDDDFDALSQTQGLLEKQPQFSLPVAAFVPKSVSAWKRNLMRAFIASFVVLIAVFLRNIFAYVNALVGAVGSGPLLFILPCFFHNRLVGDEIPKLTYYKNIAIMVFGVICSIVGLIVSVVEVVEKI